MLNVMMNGMSQTAAAATPVQLAACETQVELGGEGTSFYMNENIVGNKREK